MPKPPSCAASHWRRAALGHRVPRPPPIGSRFVERTRGTDSSVERTVREVLRRRAERRPLAADQAQHGRLRVAVERRRLDPVVARDEARRDVAVTGKRPHSGEAVDDLGPVDRQTRQHLPDEVDEVVDLLFGAQDGVRHVVLEVGRADEHPALEGIDEDDPPVAVLEEQLATARRLEQLRVVEHDVRALRAAHERGRLAESRVRLVGPRARGVDDDGCRERRLIACLEVAQHDAAALDACGGGVVGRAGTTSSDREGIAQDVDREPLGIVERSIPVGRRVFDLGVQPRERLERLRATFERVARNAAAAAREGVVDDEADLDEDGAALARTRAAAVAQEPQRSTARGPRTS